MNSFTLVRRIAARPSIVFEAMTTAEGIASWWGPDDLPVLRAESDPRVGGAYRVRFRTLDGREHEASGEYVEVVPPRRIVMSWSFTFGGEPDEAGRTSRIEVDLVPRADGGTELRFTQSGLASKVSAESHTAGWAGAFDKLERLWSAPSQKEGTT
ncbi:MAG TPA: SRPBCC domain-containing protein [Polyangiaceae bacterium]|jgi:uncharacterized protein YndB with AHSA1/START domain